MMIARKTQSTKEVVFVSKARFAVQWTTSDALYLQ